MHRNKSFLCFLILTLTAGSPAGYSQEKVPDSSVVSKSVKAIGYRVGGGSTKVDLKGTDLMPEATGEIKVAAKAGATNIDVEDQGDDPAIQAWRRISNLRSVGSYTRRAYR